MNPQEFLSIAIVGIGASVLVSFIKSRFGDLTGNKTKALIVAIAVVFGLGFYLVQGTSLYQPILMILGFASTVYAFLIKS